MDAQALRAGTVSSSAPYKFAMPPTWREGRVANILSGNYCQASRSYGRCLIGTSRQSVRVSSMQVCIGCNSSSAVAREYRSRHGAGASCALRLQ